MRKQQWMLMVCVSPGIHSSLSAYTYTSCCIPAPLPPAFAASSFHQLLPVRVPNEAQWECSPASSLQTCPLSGIPTEFGCLGSLFLVPCGLAAPALMHHSHRRANVCDSHSRIHKKTMNICVRITDYRTGCCWANVAVSVGTLNVESGTVIHLNKDPQYQIFIMGIIRWTTMFIPSVVAWCSDTITPRQQADCKRSPSSTPDLSEGPQSAASWLASSLSESASPVLSPLSGSVTVKAALRGRWKYWGLCSFFRCTDGPTLMGLAASCGRYWKHRDRSDSFGLVCPSFLF